MMNPNPQGVARLMLARLRVAAAAPEDRAQVQEREVEAMLAEMQERRQQPLSRRYDELYYRPGRCRW